MTNEHVEFLISQAIDGTLSPSEMDELNTTLKTDAAARQLYAEYQELNREIQLQSYDSILHEAQLDDAAWNKLSLHISSMVASPAVHSQEALEFPSSIIDRTPANMGMMMTRGQDQTAEEPAEKSETIRMPLDDATQFELRLCSYADGAMDDVESREFERLIAGDPVSKTLIAQHQKLSTVLKNESDLPAWNYNRLSLHLIGYVARHAGAAGRHQIVFKGTSTVGKTESSEPIQLPRTRTGQKKFWSGLAIAASIILCTAISIKVAMLQKATDPNMRIAVGPSNIIKPGDTKPGNAAPIVDIQINSIASATGSVEVKPAIAVSIGSPTAIAEITIGAGPNSTGSFDLIENNTGIISYSSHSLIAISTPAEKEPSASDTNIGPY